MAVYYECDGCGSKMTEQNEYRIEVACAHNDKYQGNVKLNRDLCQNCARQLKGDVDPKLWPRVAPPKENTNGQ